MKNSLALKNRIQKNLQRLKSWIKSHHIEAYRLYDKDIPEIPFIIDIYKNCAVVYEKGKLLEDTEKNLELRNSNYHLIVKILEELLSIPEANVFFKIRKKQKGLSQYEVLAKNSKSFSIKENNLHFKVNLSDYLDTGIFLDHRPIRTEFLKKKLEGKFLNLFCYTGSVSLCAAASGYQVTSVDMSKTYLNWAKENFEINNIKTENHKFINADVLIYLKDCREKFDIIFLDPPSFSNSKKMEGVFDVITDQTSLVESCMRLLNSNGVLYFSNNARKFKLSPEVQTKYQVQDISDWSIPIDFRDKNIHKCYKITAR